MISESFISNKYITDKFIFVNILSIFIAFVLYLYTIFQPEDDKSIYLWQGLLVISIFMQFFARIYSMPIVNKNKQLIDEMNEDTI